MNKTLVNIRLYSRKICYCPEINIIISKIKALNASARMSTAYEQCLIYTNYHRSKHKKYVYKSIYYFFLLYIDVIERPQNAQVNY